MKFLDRSFQTIGTYNGPHKSSDRTNTHKQTDASKSVTTPHSRTIINAHKWSVRIFRGVQKVRTCLVFASNFVKS